NAELEMNYYRESCPRAEEIIRQQVETLYYKHGNTAVSWLRNLFHDCVVKSCDASLLRHTETHSRKNVSGTVSCADIVALSAREYCHGTIFELHRPIDLSLSAWHGAHSVGRVHCVNLVHRLYPTIDPTLDPNYALYLKNRCPSPTPDPNAVLYSRNDRETPMVVDNMYYKNIMARKGLLVIDDELATDPRTAPFVAKMAANNGYFYEQFSRGVRLLSETNPHR
ncbi:hypothetical protein Bca52824_096329, partial [Brassica carinata]